MSESERAAEREAEPVKEALHHYLRGQRATLLWKLEGLSEREARWPRTPTGTNLLGLVKHAASMESEYFGFVVGRPFPEDLPWSGEDAEPNADLWAGPDETIASVTAFAQRVWAHADATIEALSLDSPANVPWWGPDGTRTHLGAVMTHVVAELARHAGHADILRELADGSVGYLPQWSGMPSEDPQFWAEHVARMKAVATDAEAEAAEGEQRA